MVLNGSWITFDPWKDKRSKEREVVFFRSRGEGREERKKGREGKLRVAEKRLGALETRKVTDHAYGNFRFRLDKVL